MLSILLIYSLINIGQSNHTATAEIVIPTALCENQDSTAVQLVDPTGAQLTLDDLKKRHAGKILVVDFWASWCGPCREPMPEAKKLIEAMKGKDIAFVYLSIDKDASRWKKASDEEKLDTYAENYLITNQHSARFLKEQNLTFIPRAMIFDKAGRLIIPSGYLGGMDQLEEFTKLADKP
ncbi:TlpA family protein disulfide reductase [Dyadobacter pollutisoli]|jgi:thiol-disulfide isomerase/thioredoxin|uniref:TlpA disulfide reductase family protein n=1 Tax=Dyadobacter pollutisoli TaxID=2910158 RepID=A0A9E8SKJ6_9BACT|nr:TlpA disulfide reductase family protein [Dyadobacter pollutisoli]WAC12555.1 TlpA disulfide reductase family protein [Dyadobacter pollutisoli]